MIKSTIELNYDARNGDKKAVIEMEISAWVTNQAGVIYTVNDYAVGENNAKTLINSKDIFYSAEQINQMDVMITSTSDFAGLSRTEKELLKVKKALLYITQQTPVYGSIATNWVEV